MKTMTIIKAHKYSSYHKKQIDKSFECGCFYCLAVFSPNEIKEWIDNDKTALCIKCKIDSVLPDFSVKFDKKFLKAMNKYWFSGI